MSETAVDKRNVLIGAFIEGMNYYCGGIEGMKVQLINFFNTARRAADTAPWFKWDDLFDIVNEVDSIKDKMEEQFEQKYYLNVKDLLDLKDESGLSHAGLRIWRKKFGIFFASELELTIHLKNQYRLFLQILKPYPTATGYGVNANILSNLIKYSQPQLFRKTSKDIYGFNFDATQTGGQSLTSGTIRFLNNELLQAGYKTCSPKEEWKFVLYYGKDSNHELYSNVFYSNDKGNFLSNFFFF